MIKIIHPGFYTTVQDFGRNGFKQYGVPISGVMDAIAAKTANYLLGNTPECAVLEITMSGPKLEFQVNTSICISGAYINPCVNGNAIKNYRLVFINKGDILSFGRLQAGFRCYLAVYKGFKSEYVMGSYSMYNGITKQNVLVKGEVLKIEEYDKPPKKMYSRLKVRNHYLKSHEIVVFKGPEYDKLSGEEQNELFSRSFKISKDNNRMAYQLSETLENNISSILTTGVMPGTVQLTPSGKLIILMKDCQTTGGYPRILQLTNEAIATLAQKYTGNSIRFKLKMY